jgi:UDP-GlcNAc:undecaprenyl-phosphate GlcNAc-1-phosphate transferase
MLQLSPYITLPGLSFLVCAVLTPIVRQGAVRSGWVAVPRKDRWHKKPTALLGGIAIYCAAAIPLLWSADFGSIVEYVQVHAPGAIPPSYIAVVWLGMTVLFILGLLDDLFGLRPQNKLIVQIMVASMVAFLGYRLQWVVSLTGDTIITIIWIVGITNAVNLLDNMDGLCAGICLIAAVFFSLLHFGDGSSQVVSVSLLLIGASAAFLIYNFRPASIFMGDCGSLLIGFALSMLCLHPVTRPLHFTASLYAFPVLLLMVPIFDTTMVTFIRLLSGRKPSTGGRDHTSHRLVLMGFSETGAVLFLYGTAILSGLAAVFVQQHDSLAAPTVIIPLALSVILMGIYLAQIRVYPEKEFSVLREGRYTPIILEITFKRQIFHVGLDLVLVAFAYYLSYRVRFGFGHEFNIFFQVFLKSLPAIIICKFVAFFSLGVYRGMWRYMGLSDVFVYLKASLLGTLLALAFVTYSYRFASFSKGVFLIDWFLATAFLVGSRASFRSFREFMKYRTLEGENVLIYGAGHGGQVLLKEILENKRFAVKPVGFIDDDVTKVGKRLDGYPVMGTGANLEEILEKVSVTGMIISCRDMSEESQERLTDLCRSKGIYLKRFVINLQDVNIEQGPS